MVGQEVVPSHFANFRCDIESETVDREIKGHSEHHNHSENYQERSKGQSKHQCRVYNSEDLSASRKKYYHLTDDTIVSYPL